MSTNQRGPAPVGVTVEQVAAERAALPPRPSATMPAGPSRVGIDVEAMVRRLPRGHMAAAMERVRADPDAVDRALAADEERAREEIRQVGRRARWSSYARQVPAQYTDASYGRLHPEQDPSGKITRWWGSGSRTLVLAGEPGRGKTDAAYAVCNEVAAADRDGAGSATVVRAVRAVDLRGWLTPPAEHERRDETMSANRARSMDAARSCALLLLDDATAASPTDWFREKLWDLLDQRVAEQRRTILTVNAPNREAFAKHMADQFGSAIVSRLRSDAVMVWVDGPDRRSFASWDPFA